MKGYDYWKTNAPEPPEVDECPLCSEPLEKDGDGYRCLECGYSVYPPEGV